MCRPCVISPVEAGSVPIVPRTVPLRGVIEGFYGTPWTPEARIATVELLGAHGMNAYVYAPKDDPRHRAEWREPYDAEAAAAFADLARAGEASGVEIGFALSPGLDVDYGSTVDRDALAGKLDAVRGLGIDWLVLALDDIPMRDGLAAEQAELTAWLVDRCAGARVTLVPTEYLGTRPSPYLSTLAAGLPDGVDVMWTGPTVCSPTISAADARGWAVALGGRRPVVWDNYPVNDATMSRALHLGPYRGREAALTDEVDGILCNPMTQARASWVAILTAAEYLRDPAGYDEAAAWERALDTVGGPNAVPLRALATACADSPVAPPDRMPLAGLLDRLEAVLADRSDPSAPAPTLAAVREHLEAVQRAPADWPIGDPLRTEVAPWLTATGAAAAAGLAAVRLVERCNAPEPGSAESLMQHAFGVLYLWDGVRRVRETVFGPRFAVYAAIVQRADGSPALDVSEALREDANAIDRCCRLALAEYRRWAGMPMTSESERRDPRNAA